MVNGLLDSVDDGSIALIAGMLPEGLSSLGVGIIKANYTRADIQIYRSS